MTDIVLVLTTVADADSAHALAARLVDERLCACVNILAPCTSLYRWQGKTEQAHEYPLLIKCTREGYDAVEQFIRAHHPYELPEIIAVPVERGLPGYLSWIQAQVLPAS